MPFRKKSPNFFWETSNSFLSLFLNFSFGLFFLNHLHYFSTLNFQIIQLIIRQRDNINLSIVCRNQIHPTFKHKKQ